MNDLNPFDAAIARIIASMDETDKKMLRALPPAMVNGHMAALHFNTGRHIRNDLGLWDKTSPIYCHLNAVHGLWHGDDMGAVVMDAILRDIRGEPRRTVELVARFAHHWEQMGIDPKTGEQVRPMPKSMTILVKAPNPFDRN